MSTDPCEAFRGMIAVEVVGRISVPERVALRAHTEGCAACRDERHHLLQLGPALDTADPDRFDEQEMPFALRTAVLDRLAAEGRRARRHTLRVRVAVGAVAAAVAAVALVFTLTGPSGPAVTTVALKGPPGVHAQVRLTAEPWGTSMVLRETGQPPGQMLSVAMRTVSGSWWQAGTYRTVGSSVRVTMACALKLRDINLLWVRNSTGAVVLRGAVGTYNEAGD